MAKELSLARLAHLLRLNEKLSPYYQWRHLSEQRRRSPFPVLMAQRRTKWGAVTRMQLAASPSQMLLTYLFAENLGLSCQQVARDASWCALLPFFHPQAACNWTHDSDAVETPNYPCSSHLRSPTHSVLITFPVLARTFTLELPMVGAENSSW